MTMTREYPVKINVCEVFVSSPSGVKWVIRAAEDMDYFPTPLTLESFLIDEENCYRFACPCGADVDYDGSVTDAVRSCIGHAFVAHAIRL